MEGRLNGPIPLWAGKQGIEDTFREYFPGYIKGSVLFYGEGPLYQGDFSLFNFQAGDTTGVDTAPGVHIIRGCRVKMGPVGMAYNQRHTLGLGIIAQTAFDPVLAGIVFGCAGGVKDAEVLQGFPEITDQKAGKLPEGGIHNIRLMAVGEIQPVIFPGAFQDDPFMEGDMGKKGLVALGIRAEIRRAEGFAIALLFLCHIMVAIDHIQAVLPVEEGEEPEHITVDLNNLAHSPVFPQLIPVSQLNIGETLGIIMVQGSKV